MLIFCSSWLHLPIFFCEFSLLLHSIFLLRNWRCGTINCTSSLLWFNMVNSYIRVTWLLVSFSFKEKIKSFFFFISPITGKWWTTCTRWTYVQALARLLTSASPGSVRATWWRGGSILSKAGTRWVQNIGQNCNFNIKEIHKLCTKAELLCLSHRQGNVFIKS